MRRATRGGRRHRRLRPKVRRGSGTRGSTAFLRLRPGWKLAPIATIAADPISATSAAPQNMLSNIRHSRSGAPPQAARTHG